MGDEEAKSDLICFVSSVLILLFSNMKEFLHVWLIKKCVRLVETK